MWLCLETAEVRPWRCRRNGCLHCGPVNALLLAGAIAEAMPERLGLLTLVGEEWATRRQRARDFVVDVRSTGVRWEWAWHIEPNPRGSGHHLHFVQHGDRAPVSVVRWAATRRGMGQWVGIHRIRALDRAAMYGLKLAASAYGIKGALESGTLAQYRAANGGRRLVHTSRGFWRDRDGRAIRSTRGAVQNALQVAHGQREGTWVLEHETTLGRA